MRFCYDTISRPCKICRRFIWKREASKERRSSKGEETMMSRVAARRLSSLSSAAWTPARAASSHWNPMERSDSSPSKDLRSGSFSSFFFSRPESHLPRRGLFSVLFCNSRLIFRVPSSWNHRVLPYLGFSVAHGLYLWKLFFVFFLIGTIIFDWEVVNRISGGFGFSFSFCWWGCMCTIQLMYRRFYSGGEMRDFSFAWIHFPYWKRGILQILCREWGILYWKW